MGKKQVRVVVVRKWVTVALLALVSLLLVAFVLFLSGKAYLHERPPLSLLSARSPEAALAGLAPAIANFLLLVPWGLLAFLALDRAGRSRLQTYLATALGALAFSAAVDAWQYFLPTRVTGWLDLPWNLLGALSGATLGHARKRLRIQFP